MNKNLQDKENENKLELQRLEKEECLTLRPLWEEVFYEDSDEFTDYYFREKAARNQAFVLNGWEGARAMLYLAPYPVEIRVGTQLELREINYIIGVATKKEYRHRGYMKRLLREALQDMYGKRQPFTFLMPADPAIYQPYQFTYIYDRQEYKWRGYGKQEAEQPLPDFMKESEIPPLKAFASKWLAKHYDVFIRRDTEYYKVLMKELKAQNGGICLLRDGQEINGYFLYTHEEQGEIQEVVCEVGKEYPFMEKADKTPTIMARIIDVREILSLLRTRGNSQEVILRVEDPVLRDNSGTWQCLWKKDRGEVKAADTVPTNLSLPELSVTIENLAAWIFGYKGAEKCFEVTTDISEQERYKLFERLAEVELLNRVFINEIV